MARCRRRWMRGTGLLYWSRGVSEFSPSPLRDEGAIEMNRAPAKELLPPRRHRTAARCDHPRAFRRRRGALALDHEAVVSHNPQGRQTPDLRRTSSGEVDRAGARAARGADSARATASVSGRPTTSSGCCCRWPRLASARCSSTSIPPTDAANWPTRWSAPRFRACSPSPSFRSSDYVAMLVELLPELKEQSAAT